MNIALVLPIDSDQSGVLQFVLVNAQSQVLAELLPEDKLITPTRDKEFVNLYFQTG